MEESNGANVLGILYKEGTLNNLNDLKFLAINV